MGRKSEPKWPEAMLGYSADQLVEQFRSLGDHAREETWFQLYHDGVYALPVLNRRSLQQWLRRADSVMSQLGFQLSADNRKTLMLDCCVRWDPTLTLWFGKRLGMAPEEWAPLIQEELLSNACIDTQTHLRRVRRLAQMTNVELDDDWNAWASEGIQEYARIRGLAT